MQRKSFFILLLITAFWGLTFPLVRNAVALVDPFIFVGIRFLLAALLLFPFIIPALRSSNRSYFIHGLILGILNGLGFLTQTLGLQTISSARASFITGFSVILVPFLMPLFHLDKPRILDILCAFICLIGLFILTGGHFRHFTLGDMWVLICAALFALCITYIQFITQTYKDYKTLTFYQIFFSAPLCLVFTHPAGYIPLWHTQVILAILYCVIFATIFALYMQMKYQRYISAAKAALIFALEPVFASFFGWLINNEKVSLAIYAGGSLMLLSVALPALVQLFRGKEETATIKNV